ncbi:MAG: Hsp20/alpha crystallin family protein [Desulfovibrionaceae bacterium]|nr:Hsp20/alpha crystallin family protein [Desulfovibrionaceae bacterium]
MNKTTRKSTGIIPPTDILEMEDGFHIIMDLPGVSQENLTVDIEESELAINATSSYSEAGNDSRRLHTEFGNHNYQRSFTLSDMVDREHVKAVLRHGVLRLYLPKAEAMKPRRIKIS